jgi:hypothetical protein
MSAVVATEREAVYDCFINDIVRVMLHQEGDQGRYARDTEAVPLAIHAPTMRPHGGDESEPVPRRPLLSDTKLEAEGTPAEKQMVLGWEIDTGELTIRLPWDKYVAWVEDIADAALRKGMCRNMNWSPLWGGLTTPPSLSRSPDTSFGTCASRSLTEESRVLM